MERNGFCFFASQCGFFPKLKRMKAPAVAVSSDIFVFLFSLCVYLSNEWSTKAFRFLPMCHSSILLLQIKRLNNLHYSHAQVQPTFFAGLVQKLKAYYGSRALLHSGKKRARPEKFMYLLYTKLYGRHINHQIKMERVRKRGRTEKYMSREIRVTKHGSSITTRLLTEFVTSHLGCWISWNMTRKSITYMRDVTA